MGRHFQFMPFSALLALVLSALTLLGQDTVPPPPPDNPAETAALADQPTQSSVRAVRLSDVEGQVQVFRGDQLAFEQAEPNMPAVEGMRFVTGSNGRLEIEFEDGSVARMTPNSSVQLTQLQRNPDGGTVTRIDALTGLSYYELNGRSGQYTVHFASDIASVQESAVFRIDLDVVPNQLAVMHGGVHIDDGGGTVSVDVHPSQTFQTDPQQGGAFTVAQSIDANSWDQWNSDRDQALANLDASQSTARASTGEPDNPAWNDLDYYGNWYDVPGYGQVCAPSGVGQDWDPFGNGYWGYYPSFGYTWISGYPWGWWPYHCGAWTFSGGWGWFWVPGNCGWGLYGAGWFPYATVWHCPEGYVPPARPHFPPIRPHGLNDRDARRIHPQPLIAVNRGPQYGQPFRVHGARPLPRPLSFQGQTISPLPHTIRPLRPGPLGESFTNSLVRTHPEMNPSISPGLGSSRPGFPGTPGYRAPGSNGQRIYTPPAEIRPMRPTEIRPIRPQPEIGAPRNAPPPMRTAPPPPPHPVAPRPSPPAGGIAPHPGGSAHH
jgi:hypothetical protein